MILFYIITMIHASQSLSIRSLDTTLRGKAPVSANITKPSDLLTKIKSNPKEFVAEIQTLDPETLQTVRTLIEGLIQSSEDKEQELIDDLAVKLAQLNEANTNIVNAEESLNNANQAVAEAQTVANAAATHLDNMKEIQVEKTRKKENSQTNHDNEIPSLNDEQQVLTNIFDMLNSLPGGQDSPVASPVASPVTSPRGRWIKGLNGEDCIKVCSDNSFSSCNTDKLNELTTESALFAAFREAGYECPKFGGLRDYDGAPFTATHSSGPDYCYGVSPGSNVDCVGNAASHHAPLCWCE